MNGIVINIDPVILQVGHFSLRWYSLFIIVAIIAAVFISIREARRGGLSADDIFSLAPWVIVAGLVAARLFHVVDQWSYYAVNPVQIFQIQQGGLAIWGAVIGGALATILYARARHLSLGRLMDILVPGLLTAQMIGRIGCIINGDAWGDVTNLPWGFIYLHPGAMLPANLIGVPTHPYPVYEILWNGLVLWLVLRLRPRLTRDGLLVVSYLALYSLGRFGLTFIRQENQFFWGLQQAQIVAAVVFLAALGVIVYLARTRRVSHNV